MKKQYRQGDVLVQELANIPTASLKRKMVREQNGVILAHGEVTGHAHAILEKGVAQFKTQHSGVTALEIREAVALLKHEEHGTVEIPKGTYEVIRQREYTPQAIVNVAD